MSHRSHEQIAGFSRVWNHCKSGHPPEVIGAHTVASQGIDAPRNKMTNGDFTDQITISAIEGWAAEVVIATRLAHDQRVVRATPILEPLGIDPARFGQ